MNTLDPIDTVAVPNNQEIFTAIDDFLTSIMHQTIIDTSRVIDFTLDLRQILLREE